MNLNKVQLIGNLTRDPELKSLPTGMAVVNFSLATNRVYKDKNGAKQEEAEFHNIVAFGRTAEIIHQYSKKGASLYIEGRLKTSSWDDKETNKKMYRTEIVAENIQLGSRPAGNSSAYTPAPAASSAPAKVQEPEVYNEPNINPDDIPF